MAIRKLALCATALIAAACSPSTPAPTAWTADSAKQAASAYDARIIRDKFGVPHIYGKRNADVVFGLAYAHSEDDWKNIEEVIRSSRGTLAEIVGEAGAKSDDFILSLGNTEIVNRDYDAKVSPEAKAIAAGFQVPSLDDTGQPTTRDGILADHFPLVYPNDIAAHAANNGAAPPDLSLMAKARANGHTVRIGMNAPRSVTKSNPSASCRGSSALQQYSRTMSSTNFGFS